MSAEVINWREEHGFDHRRRLRNGGLVSVAIHGLLFTILVISPAKEAPLMPEVVSVDLVAAPFVAGARPAPPRRADPPPPAPDPPKAPEPAPAPEPIAPEPPPPPKPKAPVQVIPEKPPEPVPKEKPKPEIKRPEVKKPVAKPAPRRPRGQPEKEMSLEDAMAALGEEVGPDETSDLLQAQPSPADRAAAAAAAAAADQAARAQAQLASEFSAWMVAAKREIQSKWVTPTDLRGRGLETTLQLRISRTGEVLGTPTVHRSSGNPYFDENAVRAVLRVNPLPPPPRAGTTYFIFDSEVD